jgi:hypothetical protein
LSFKLGGDTSTFYPVVIYPSSWRYITTVYLLRRSVHFDSSWWGSVAGIFRFLPNNCGEGSSFIDYSLRWEVREFVADVSLLPGCNSNTLVLWLRGGTTYEIFGFNVGDIGYNPSIDPLVVEGVSLSSRTTISGSVIYGERLSDNLAVMGKIGIGTTSPSRKLYVNGDAGGTTQWYADSDERLKQNISPIDNPLEKVMNLRGVYFEWKDTTNHPEGRQMGVIAQEVKEVVPEVVEEKGGYYQTAISNLVALLIEAVKEQQREIEGIREYIANYFGSMSQRVRDYLSSLGVEIENGTIKAFEIVADRIKTNKVETKEVMTERIGCLTNMEMVDRKSGEIYCVWIENGEFVKRAGGCE